MADNTIINQPVTIGQSIATKDIGGVNHELVLLEFDDGAGGASEVSALKPLPVIDAQVLAKLNAGVGVAVGNFPATQPVSGTVAVSNFPATQPISGSVTVLNPTTNPETGLAKETTLGTLNTNIAKEFGTWGYVSGNLTGAGNVTGVGRCVGIRVFANGVDSTFNINGGNTITVRSNAGVDIVPKGNITNAVVNWVSGSIDVIIESVT